MVQTLEDITSEPADLSPLDVSITITSLEELLDEAASDSSVSQYLIKRTSCSETSQ